MNVVWEQLSNIVGRWVFDPDILTLTMGFRVAPTLAPFTMVELVFMDTVFPLVLFQLDLV